MINEVESKLNNLFLSFEEASFLEQNKIIDENQEFLKTVFKDLSAYDRVMLARHIKRPNALEYINYLFDDFFEMKGDRLSSDDHSIITGIARFKKTNVTIIANMKGNTFEENIRYNFGMSSPSGYKKVLRAISKAKKFNRPIITFVDTPGAYPGIDAEKTGQATAIARCLEEFSDLTVPVIAVVIGEGGSGGALAISLANKILMLENAVYSVLSPEGFASILWKSATRKKEAAEIMKLTSQDLLDLKIIDHLVDEGIGSVILNKNEVFSRLEKLLSKELNSLTKMSKANILEQRYQKFRQIGKL